MFPIQIIFKSALSKAQIEQAREICALGGGKLDGGGTDFVLTASSTLDLANFIIRLCNHVYIKTLPAFRVEKVLT